MNLSTKPYLVLILLLLFQSHTFAITQVVIGDVVGMPGDIVPVPVTINNFSGNFSGMQFYSTFENLPKGTTLNFVSVDLDNVLMNDFQISSIPSIPSLADSNEYNFLIEPIGTCGVYLGSSFTVAYINVEIPSNQANCIIVNNIPIFDIEIPPLPPFPCYPYYPCLEEAIPISSTSTDSEIPLFPNNTETWESPSLEDLGIVKPPRSEIGNINDIKVFKEDNSFFGGCGTSVLSQYEESLQLVSGSICPSSACLPKLVTNSNDVYPVGVNTIPILAEDLDCYDWTEISGTIQIGTDTSKVEILNVSSSNSNLSFDYQYDTLRNELSFLILPSSANTSFTIPNEIVYISGIPIALPEIVFDIECHMKQIGCYPIIDDISGVDIDNDTIAITSNFNQIVVVASNTSNKTTQSPEHQIGEYPIIDDISQSDSVELAIATINNTIATNKTIPNLNLQKELNITNSPNPFSTHTTIEYTLPQKEQVNIEIYDITGKRIQSLLAKREQIQGKHHVPFNGAGLADGIYLVRIQAGKEVETHRMFITK